MISPAQLLNSSAVRYQQALKSTLEFWTVDGQCKNCPHHADIKQLIKQQIDIGRVLIPCASVRQWKLPLGEVMKL